MASSQEPVLLIDIDGNSESVVLEWDFTNKLIQGETISPSPAPSILALPATPVATFSSITINSAVVLARVTLSGAIAGTNYNTTCTITTSAGNQYIGIGAFSTAGPPPTDNPWFTTPLAVQSLLGPQNYDGVTDLSQFIESANSITQGIDEFAIDTNQTISDAQLEKVERWLAAHLYTQNNPSLSSISTGGISQGLQGQSSINLRNSRWGQTAIMLDVTGYLNMIDNRAVARMNWLGRGRRGLVSGSFGSFGN